MNSIPPANFYVYILYRESIPFYIGKGSNGRIDAHEACARNKKTCPHQTCRIIRKLWREDKQITKNKICDSVTEQTAFTVEKLMISIGFASGWPLVNLTNGGEGASGYRWTSEQRRERSIRAKQDTAALERMREGNRGRQHTQAERKKRSEAIKASWTPERRQRHSEKQKVSWSKPERRDSQRAGLMRPEVYVKLGKQAIGKIPPNTKTYPGFVSPDGIVYENVFNLTAFAREHGLDQRNMQAVAKGKDYSYKGWRLYPLRDKIIPNPYRGPGFVSPEGVVYEDIISLTDFCNEHDLSMKCMSNVSRGKSRTHKGWARYNP